jgi:hypothetical protein
MIFIMQGIEFIRKVRHPAQRAVLAGNVDRIARSALSPLLESVTVLSVGHPADLPVIP